jgi:hypothetical protein
MYVYLYDVYKKYLQFFDLSLTNLKSFYLKMNSDKIFEPDLELADAFSNLFFEIIMPSLIIMGYFLTTKKVKAVVVNDFEYRYLDEPNKKDKSQERFLCMWTDGKKKCSASLTIDVNTKKITKVNGKPWDQETPLKDFHTHSCLTHSEVLKRFIRCELQEKAEISSGAIPKMFENKSTELAAAGHSIEETSRDKDK